MYYGLVPSRDAHRTLAVTTVPQTLRQMGYLFQDNDAALFDLQPTSGDIWFTKNQNSTPDPAEQLGFKLLQNTIARFTREEIAVALFVCASGTVVLQAAGSMKPMWPQLA